MLFVDGENLTLRGQRLFSGGARRLIASRYWSKDVYLWAPYNDPSGVVIRARAFGEQAAGGTRASESGRLWGSHTRAYYYTSITGDEPKAEATRETLWQLGFEPRVFRKARSAKTKAVDITMTTEVLHHAFLSNYDAVAIVAGDRDYLPLIEEAKRLGKFVVVAFLTGPESGLSDELRLAADSFIDLNQWLYEEWLRFERDEAS